MARIRRWLAATGCFVAALAVATPPVAAQSQRAERIPQPILLSDSSLAWVDGQSRWVSLSWTAQADIDDVALTVLSASPDVTIGYETPSLGRAEPAGGPELSMNEVDLTTFFLAPGADTPDDFTLELIVEWRADGELHTGTQTLRVHQETAGEAPFLVLTKSAAVPAGGDGARNWVSLGFLGLRDGIRDFSASIEGDLPVYYPQRSFTSLHHDAVLEENERDVARFWLDPSNIEPGVYQLQVIVTFTLDGGEPQEVRSLLPVTVG